jgi:hypothetical protein
MEIPPHFICPISNQIFLEPVICEDGHVYEKDMIEKWLQISQSSPITRQIMSIRYDNCTTLQEDISLFLYNFPQHRLNQYSKPIYYQTRAFWCKLLYCLFGFPIVLFIFVLFFSPTILATIFFFKFVLGWK